MTLAELEIAQVEFKRLQRLKDKRDDLTEQYEYAKTSIGFELKCADSCGGSFSVLKITQEEMLRAIRLLVDDVDKAIKQQQGVCDAL